MARQPSVAEPGALAPASSSPATPTRKTILKHTISVATSAAVTLGLVWMLLGGGQEFELGWDGGLPTLKVAAREEALGRVIETALREDPEQLRAILRARNFHPPDNIPPEQMPGILQGQLDLHATFIRGALRDLGFFRVGDSALIDALIEQPVDGPVAARLRQMLFDLEGPFAPPRTLDGARSHFITEMLEKRPPDDMVIAEVWSNFIAAHLTFLYPDLEARLVADPNLAVRPREAGARPQDAERRVRAASACVGSELVGKFVQIWRLGPDGTDAANTGLASAMRPVTLYVGLDSQLPMAQCRGEPLRLIDIARARQARLGLPRDLHATLTAEAAGASFTLIVFPAGVSPLDPRDLMHDTAAGTGEDGDDAG